MRDHQHDPELLARLWRRLQRRLDEPMRPKPVVTLDRARLTTEEVWQLWRDGFDVSAELERRMGL